MAVKLIIVLLIVTFAFDASARAYGVNGYAKKRGGGGYIDRKSWEWCSKRYPGPDLRKECYVRREK
jgi:hypothetical protein